MNAPEPIATTRSYLADTHEVINVSRELVDFNAYAQDRALVEAVRREGAAWADESLHTFGRLTGSADYLELGVLANRHPPELDTHDRFGNRVDEVHFHPSWHWLMERGVGYGLHAAAWESESPHAHVRRAAGFREALRAKGWTVGGESQIVPVVVGGSARAVALSRTLAERGILVLPVRPPTVPEGSARLRFSLTAAHTDRQLSETAEALGAA